MWTRLMNIFKAKANATLDDMENPIEMYKLGIVEFEGKMKQSESAIAKLMAQLTLRKKELEQFKLESEQRKDQAKQGITQNREDLAKTALELKASPVKKVIEYSLMVVALEKQVSDLRKDHERNKKKLKESQTKYDIYKAKYETSLAQKEIASSMSELSGESALSNLTRYEKEIEEMSAEAGALDEMVNQSGRLEDELNQITVDAEIIDEMDVLRLEAEQDKQRKEQVKIEKMHKIMFGETKKVEAPKINPLLMLPQETKDPEKVFKEHFNSEGNETEKNKKNR